MILGDVGSGKTLLTVRLLMDAVEEGFKDLITIIDLAPKAMNVKGVVVGGKMRDFFQIQGLRYLASDRIKAPRLEGRNYEEVIQYAKENLKVCEALFRDFEASPTEVLFVNDASIYLQLGDAKRLTSLLLKAKTVIMNAYEGELLQNDKGTGITVREAKGLDGLKNHVDIIIRLGRSRPSQTYG